MRQVRVGQSDLPGLRVYFTLYQTDGVTPNLIEAGGQPQTSLNGAAFVDSGIGVLVAIGFGRYYADLDPAILTTAGDIIQTIYVSGTAALAEGDTFEVTPADGSVVVGETNFDYYGSISEGDAFFANRLNADAWVSATPSDKPKALRQATLLIDRLNYAGDKADPNQPLQFPRGDTFVGILVGPDGIMVGDQNSVSTTFDVSVPEDVRQACYLIALRLLDGYDPDVEAERLTVIQNQYGGPITKYDRSIIPEHVAAGIPSAQAWALLRPYLRDPRVVELERES